MPIFEYQCQSCEHDFEYFIVRSDDSPHCPQCKGQEIKKKVTSFSVGNTAHGKLSAKKNKLRSSIAKADFNNQKTKTFNNDSHVCTSSCNHGSAQKTGAQAHQDHNHHHGGSCSAGYADELRKKHGY